jgi:tyrosyl-tRNA synthetase
MESENGISFTEFSYMLLQANDFRHLCEFENVEMQMGGSDQWGNITAGTDLIRRRLTKSGYGLTWPLLTRSDGQKMGKSVHGALWLDPEKTSPYEFRQYWVQLPDEDVERFLLQLTLRSVDDIASLMDEHRATPEKRLAQRALATDVTTLVHGAAAEQAAAEAAQVLFGGDPTTASAEALAVVAREVPSSEITREQLGDQIAVLVQSGLAASNGEARRTLTQKGFKANGQTLEETKSLLEVDLLHGRYMLLRKGKTNFHLLTVTN